jgi:uncharacterized protein YhdP
VDEDRGFDLDAAGLRAGGADLATAVEVLAVKLEAALPAETVVRRRSRGLLSREKVVEEIEVALGDWRYALRIDRGRVEASRRQSVRGIAIRSEALDLDAWLQALTAELREQAATSEQARTALERLVG